jgi:hypothetical protein
VMGGRAPFIPTRILAGPFLPSASSGLEQVKVYAGWYDSACQRQGGHGSAARRAGGPWWPVMFGPPPGTRVYLACGATDTR